MRERNADLIQTHGYKASAVAWWLRRQRPEIPWIGCFHGETHEDLKARFYHWLDHRLLAKADRVVVMSMLQLAAFAHVGGRAGVIHNAVLPDPGLAGPDDAPRIRAAVKDLRRPVLGVVGRLSPEKGVDLFVDACALLRDNGDSFSAVIAGDGPERDRIEARIATLNLGGSIKVLGDVANIRVLYDVIDVLAIPSRSEGLPNVLLEALGADVPVVSTRVGAVPEVLTDPMAGRIVPPGHAGALADGIRDACRLRNDPDAQRARAATAHRFSAAARVDRHVTMYRDLVR
jgi:glycosyltransferase involved in cell wall biosynthesis